MTRRRHQPNSRVNVEQTAGPDTEINPALGHVRAGDFHLGQRPARQRPTLLANHDRQQPVCELIPCADRLPASQPHLVEPNSTTNPAECRPESARHLEPRRSPTGDETPALSCQLTHGHQLRGG